jgi:hypothetical protein
MNIDNLLKEINELNLDEKVEAINKIKLALHEISPFKTEPVDCVIWVKNQKVHSTRDGTIKAVY